MATIRDPKILADLQFEAAACLKLLLTIQTEEFTCTRTFNERMATHDRLIAEANRQRSDDTRLGLLMALTFLARCFCQGIHGDCVAAVFGQPGQQEAPENVMADDDIQNDGNFCERDEEIGSHFFNPAMDLLELPIETPSSGSDDDLIIDFEPEHLQSLHGSLTALLSAELEDGLEIQDIPPSTSHKTPLVLILSNNEAQNVPSYFKSTSELVKQAFLHGVLHPDITEQWFSFIILGRECCSSWLDERFFRLLQSLSFEDDGTAITGTGLPSRDVEDCINEWTRRGGTELDGIVTKQKDALAQLLSHFPSVDRATLGNTVTCSLFRAIVSLILRYQNGPRSVNLARDKAKVSDHCFVSLVQAMAVLGDSAFMLNIGQVPMSVSLSDSEPKNVRLRRFRRRWLRIVSLVRGARNVADIVIPMIISSFDCSDAPTWNRPGFENEFLTSDKYFQILWADQTPAPPQINCTVSQPPSPFVFITSILQQGQPPRQEEEVNRLMDEWKDTPTLSAWTRETKWDIKLHAELRLLASCSEMGFIVVENTLGVTKRPCLACGMTLPLLAPELFVSSGSTKPFALWALPDQSFISTSDLRGIVAKLKALLFDAIIRGPPVLSEVEIKAPFVMERKQNLSDSSYGSVPGGKGQTMLLANVY
ncbi:uncharacterized protein EV420DRAFT_1521261 [Desarmillaria tabescens]|uniref:Uncharacterized protein n=1 Tax=Armillaria tabescens TaxID=1929756 RepID=A0AA39NC05_ARMTA|nr:uncharacterized protein EV420DRAFT_1521261 [Desarmillaria tabescens]KAK0462847.1 hypothetical protein EV420DRAFT_1521261 [Desarmillaria tabescens]